MIGGATALYLGTVRRRCVPGDDVPGPVLFLSSPCPPGLFSSPQLSTLSAAAAHLQPHLIFFSSYRLY